MKSQNKVYAFIFLLGIGGLWSKVDFSLNSDLLNDMRDSSDFFVSSEGASLRMTTNTQEQFLVWRKVEEFPKTLIDALLVQEDRYFFSHPGVNPISFGNAIWEKLFYKKSLRGASTISMQLARLHYGLYTRSLLGKFKQMGLAFLIEAQLDKAQVLEAFLNLAPMGRNIQGFATASQIYFHRPLKQLSIEELIGLISIPQNPALLNHKSKASLPKYHQDRASRLFQKLNLKNQDFHIAEVELKAIEDIPFEAPHLVDQFMAQKIWDESSSSIKETSIQIIQQKKMEQVLELYIQNNKKAGIKNAAYMVLDWKENKVIAATGSAGFFNKKIFGQVNGTLSMRSPGSTLKPFVYALGLDQGLIYPQLVVHDAPGIYKLPQNFDRNFLGPITIEKALNQSRNVPAVALSAKLAAPSFHQFLKNTGIGDLKPQSFYGHTLVLGSKEMSMQDIIRYYAALARNGELQPLSFKKESVERKGLQIFSKDAAVLTKKMLQKTARPEFNTGRYQKYSDEIFWKTGTSWGYRDAWTFGIQGRYVLGVWVGNFSSIESEHFVGIKSAAPLFFKLLNSLPLKEKRQMSFWHGYAKNIKEVHVCSASGMYPSKHCKHKTKSLVIAGVSPSKKCHIHRPVLVSKASGLRSCLESSEENETQVFEFWPSQINRLYEKKGLFISTPPAFSKECSYQGNSIVGMAPKITYPKRSDRFVLSRLQNRGRFMFKASAESGVNELLWYKGSHFLGKSTPNEPLQVELQAGRHQVRVVDDLGRSSSKSIQVLYK